MESAEEIDGVSSVDSGDGVSVTGLELIHSIFVSQLERTSVAEAKELSPMLCCRVSLYTSRAPMLHEVNEAVGSDRRRFDD